MNKFSVALTGAALSLLMLSTPSYAATVSTFIDDAVYECPKAFQRL